MPRSIHPRPITPTLFLLLTACTAGAWLQPRAARAEDAPPPATPNDPVTPSPSVAAPSPPATPSKPAMKPEAARALTCPTDVPQTSIVVRKLNDGAALIFLAPRNIPELRRRVRALSAVQNEGAVTPPDTAPLTRVPETESEPHEPTARVYNIHGGVALKFTPSRVDQLGDVQARAFELAKRLSQGACPTGESETVLRTGTPRASTPGHSGIPAGLVPGVGGVTAGGVVVTPTLTL
jgi:hypothetical protein